MNFNVIITNNFGRKGKKLSQQALAKLANVHYTNIGKYERGKANPSSAVLNKIATVVELSPDYLINGIIKEKAENSITYNELYIQFQKVEKLPNSKKLLVKEFLDAFLFKSNNN